MKRLTSNQDHSPLTNAEIKNTEIRASIPTQQLWPDA